VELFLGDRGADSPAEGALDSLAEVAVVLLPTRALGGQVLLLVGGAKLLEEEVEQEWGLKVPRVASEFDCLSAYAILWG
jgi:hypothetical protein